MARLTWQNVDAPSFSGAADSYRLMASLLSSGLASADKALGDLKTMRQDATSAALGAEALRYRDAASYDEALRTGALTAGKTLSLDDIKFLDGRTHDLLANEGQGLLNAGRGIANDDSAFRLGVNKRNDAQSQAYLAAEPALMQRISDIETLMRSGDPAQIAQGRKMMNDAETTKLAAAAGRDGAWVADRFTANENSISGGIGSGDAVRQYGERQRSASIVNDARALVEQAFKAGSPDRALAAIRASGAPAAVQEQAIAYMSQQGPTLYGDQAATNHAANVERMIQERVGNPLVGLVDRTEGGGRYDTLFGHSQKNGGAFAGVDVTKMTIGQLDDFAGEYGPWVRDQLARQGHQARIATPMGRFQIVNSTLQQAAKEMGLSKDTVFDEATQNAVFNHLVGKRLSGPRTMEGKIAGLRQEWEGFKSVSNDELAKAITAWENGDRSVLGGMSGQGGESGGNAATNLMAGFGQNAGPVDSGATTADDTLTMDQGLAQYENMLNQFAERPNRGQTVGQLAGDLDSKYGGSANNEWIDKYSLEKAIQDTMDEYKVDSDIAAAMVENSIRSFSSRRSLNPVRWVAPGLLAPNDREVNMDEVRNIYERFIDKDTRQPLEKGISQLQTRRKQEALRASIKEIQSVTQSHEAEYNRVRSRSTSTPEEIARAKAALDVARAYERQAVDAINSDPALRANSLKVTRDKPKEAPQAPAARDEELMFKSFFPWRFN